MFYPQGMKERWGRYENPASEVNAPVSDAKISQYNPWYTRIGMPDR